MKRCWFGAAVLVVLLVLGLISSFWMNARQAEISRLVQRTAQAAESGDWPRAEEAAARAQALWENGRTPDAILSDHAPMEQVDCFFRLLGNALRRQDAPGTGDLCAQIAQTLEVLAEDHRLSFENLL